MKDYIEALEYSYNHREKLLADEKCGCFYCLTIFNPKEILDWVDDISATAICPYCGVDSIIGESSGYPITKEFLSEMHNYSF